MLNSLARNTTNGVSFNEEKTLSVCTRGEDFVLDIGSITVIGPSPLSQEITCIAGRVCDLQIFGVGIEDDNDKPYQPYMILDTCGINSGYKRSDIQKHSPMPAGGSYQLCWCGSSGFSCQVPAEFLLRFGEVQVLGPTLQQDRSCVAGQSCRLESIISFGPGFGEILVLDTCSVSTPNFLDNSISTNELRNSNLPFLGVLSSNSSWQSTWQFGPLLAGKYRLCWSSLSWNWEAELASNVSKFTSFVDIGMLWIRGTSQFQDRTCISGQTCRIDGILGLGLNRVAGNSVMALHTCGLNTTVIPHWSWSSSAEKTENGRNSENGTAFSWGSEVVSAMGGQYRLCWCGAFCDTPKDFVIDFGSMLLLGPGSDTQTCISGQRCVLRLDQWPSPSEFVILDTCGIASQVSYFPAISLASNASVSLGWITASGEYRVCWCALQSDWDCENAKQFHDVGSLVLLGPTLEQDKTCISGQSCRIDVAGIGLEGTFAILDTCGTGDSERDRAQGLGIPGWSVFVPALSET